MDGKAGQASASADDDSRAEHALIGSGPIESLAGPESEPPGEHTPYETGPARSASEASAPVDRDGEHACNSTSISSAQSSSAIAGPAMVNSAKAFASVFQQLPGHGFKQVWEDGVWGQIFGDDDPMKLWGLQGPEAKRPVPPEGIRIDQTQPSEEEPRIKRSRSEIVGPLFKSAVSRRTVQDWKTERSKELAEALHLWASLLSGWSDVGGVIGQFRGCASKSDAADMVADFTRGKAPSTLRKRARSMLHLMEWLRADSRSMPCSESDFYEYLKVQKVSKAPLSRLKSALESIRFCRHTFSVDSLDEICRSRRCRGVCMSDTVRPAEQSAPLRVDELRVLHNLLEGDSKWDAVAAGACLLATYARARWSDLMHTEDWSVDLDRDMSSAYLECRVVVHKTMGATNNRHKLLPLVAPSPGIVEGDWISQWFKARASLGIKPPPEHPVMPAPSEAGEPTERPVDTSEISKWLQGLLRLKTEDLSSRKVTSHSMKCTMLSYCAKYGVPTLDRLILGYHTGNASMAITYARDATAPQMRILDEVLEAIRDGKFLPDLPRGLRVTQTTRTQGSAPVQPPVEQPPVKVEVEDSGDEAPKQETSSLSAETATESSDESHDGSIAQAPVREQLCMPVGTQKWRHVKSRIFHLMPEHYNKVFFCGRKVGPHHEKYEGDLPRMPSKCRLCFRIMAQGNP